MERHRHLLFGLIFLTAGAMIRGVKQFVNAGLSVVGLRLGEYGIILDVIGGMTFLAGLSLLTFMLAESAYAALKEGEEEGSPHPGTAGDTAQS